MPRTDAAAVGGIIEVDPEIDLTPFIDPANQLVTELCVGKGHSDERLEMIERYLAAHFYTLRDPRNVMERAGDVQEIRQSKVDLFLSTSHYGQMAVSLDTSGSLATLNNPRITRVASVTWLGTVEE